MVALIFTKWLGGSGGGREAVVGVAECRERGKVAAGHALVPFPAYVPALSSHLRHFRMSMGVTRSPLRNGKQIEEAQVC